jgi:NADPH:quinone reductase
VTTTARMRAAVLTRYGGPEVLEVREVERPVPGVQQVLVRVRASALNRADLLQRQGKYPAPAGESAEILGVELAGEITQLGPGVSQWREGDRVFGITGAGGHAEFIVVHERALARIPDGLSWQEAGSIPEAFITAHDALMTQAHVRPSERVLVHAVGSGVGLAAIQLARAAGAVPYGSARTAHKIERARAYGLEDGIVVHGDLSIVAERTTHWTGGAGMQIVLDLVGGEYVAASVRAAAPKGRIMLIGTVAGPTSTLPLAMVLGKRLTIRGTVLRARPIEEKIAATRAFAEQVVPLFERGILRTVIDRVFPLAAIAEAHAHLESNETFGKVVLDVGV